MQIACRDSKQCFAAISRARAVIQESAEISLVSALACTEQSLGLCKVVARRRELASDCRLPTWVKSLPALPQRFGKKSYREIELLEELHPKRGYLQTAGLATTITDIAELSEQFTRAGVQRICEVGCMHEIVGGEPHDGRYALTSYAKRIIGQFPNMLRDFANLQELREVPANITNAACGHG